VKTEFLPLTPARWSELERLFGERGACGGCWCMAWRLPRSRWEAQKGKGNRRAFRALVLAGPPPGILAYRDGKAVGWCAIGPRANYSGLARSRVLAPLDAQEVWSVTCLFVAKPERRRGLSKRLLRAAAAYAKTQGARLVEGYPVEPDQRLPDPFVWTGLASAFRAAGFVEVARRSRTRPIMRRVVKGRGAR
jgi:GNAT superfamily N-acetyltransferase